MPFKLNISNKGKAWKIEKEFEFIVGKSIGDKFSGKEISHDLEGYELQITGGSDLSGFPLYSKVEGIGLKKMLLKKGFGMRNNTSGLRLRKTVRGKNIADKTSQINIKVLKEGHKNLEQIFPEQNQPKEKKVEQTPQTQ